ncbi:MAG: sugar transferase [Pseudomonadota bacterium]
MEGVPIVGGLELAPILAQRLGIRSAVIAMPKLDSAALLSVIERYAEGYSSVLVIPDLFNVAHFGTPTHSLGGVLGIEVRRQLLLAGPRLAKRLMDVVLTTLGGLPLLPFVALVSLLIKLDSKGTVFYHQKRLGQDGVRFKAFKFRTMYGDGEERLREVLENNPQMRAEYEQFHKLSVDPRVTRIGRVLRKYSLDELPQIWSVFVGDMSLVGPRPYLEREIPEMNGQEAIILRVKPGITGIWQVTERNASTFEQRVQLDVEYVRSWSPCSTCTCWRARFLSCSGAPALEFCSPAFHSLASTRVRIGKIAIDVLDFEGALDANRSLGSRARGWHRVHAKCRSRGDGRA